MIIPVHTYSVTPRLPERLQALDELSKNLWWSWNADAALLFGRLDHKLWLETYHSPRKLLGQVSQERLDEALADESFLSQLDRIKKQFDDYMADRKNCWFEQEHDGLDESAPNHRPAPRIAYFSAEFGLHESVPLYSGGLGCLAGDHLKSASDLGVPLVAIGLAYRHGYFQQYLNHDGYQQENYPENDFHNMPMELQLDGRGEPLNVDVHLPGRLLYAQIWKIQVGRVPLYLLDTNIERNRLEDRLVTSELYGGDREMRLKQEILLGIGGARALKALGLDPDVVHINEGHAAFACLERLAMLMREKGATYGQARELVEASTIFTTHTPVPAGHDVFGLDMVAKYLGYRAEELGLSQEEFFALGSEEPGKPPENFSMTGLALRLSARRNGVARLHGEVARDMWTKMWPGVPVEDVPIGSVTNGVHMGSWLSADMAELYERYLGPRALSQPWDQKSWRRTDAIPDAELWRTHERRRERLVAFARRRLADQFARRHGSASGQKAASEVLDPEALTIGFARRFATYKRATLLFRHLDRLEKLLGDKKRPVQLVFAGKAHPQDKGGKELIKNIVSACKEPRFQRRVIFIEDYDINVARYMVQGVDVWLNTPRRPQEASGTSGMKVVLNGGIHCSILDGWWDEAFTPDTGWAIGSGEIYEDLEQEDEVESLLLYDLLEKEIIPRFFDRGEDGVPRGWTAMMKASIKRNAPYFNTGRMVSEYVERFYLPAAEKSAALNADGMARASGLSDFRAKLHAHWSSVSIERILMDKDGGGAAVGSTVRAKADIALGPISPAEVSVDLYHGEVDGDGRLVNGKATPMSLESEGFSDEGRYRFAGEIPCDRAGLNGFAVRVLPRHEDLSSPYEPLLIKWA